MAALLALATGITDLWLYDANPVADVALFTLGAVLCATKINKGGRR